MPMPFAVRDVLIADAQGPSVPIHLVAEGARLADVAGLTQVQTAWLDAQRFNGAQRRAVLLPGAFYFLRETQKPPVELFRKHGVKIAIATDCNPGSSPLTSLLLVMNMAATLFRLTVDEIIAGVTREAARALGRLGDTGTLEAGKWCDLAIWNVERLAELPYRMGFNPLHARVWRGR